jgi:hypothetical protein
MKLLYPALPLLAAACALAQQPSGETTPSLAEEAKQAYSRVKTNILKAAEKMPESDYSFKATPEVRPFSELLAHVAGSQFRACSLLTGASPAAAPSSPTKASLTAYLQASFDNCDKAYDSVTPANQGEWIGSGYMHHSRIGLLWYNATHLNEMYGTMSVYMRLKGLVPPSSERR